MNELQEPRGVPHAGGLTAGLRRTFLRAPLFLPLVGVVGALTGDMGWIAAVAALLSAVVLKLWRIGLALVLCVTLAWLQQDRLQRSADQLQAQLEACKVVELQGIVVRELRNGCILDADGVRVALRGEGVVWQLGDSVKVRAERSREQTTPVRGMFDASRWRKQQGLAADLRLVEGEYKGHPFSWAAVCGAAAAVRESLARRVMPLGTESDARRQVLCALVLGDKTHAEEETMLDFRRGGCLHAFAVSGLHVGLLAGIVWGLLRVCRVRLGVARVVILVVAGLYVVMTGFAVPAVRAYAMSAVILLGAILHRRVSLLNTWSFVALLVLLPQPYQLYNAGFQLSFVVYAAICAGARICLREKPWFGPDEYIPYRIRTSLERRISRLELALRGIVIVSLWAWLVSLPITIAQFHTLNAHSFITNILISPLLPLVMGCGLAAMVLGSVPVLGSLLTQLALCCAQCLISVVSLCGAIPAAYLPAQTPQSAGCIAVISTGYGGSSCQLGNGGLLIASGNEQTARFHIEPAVFHSGLTPAALLLPRPSARRTELADVFTAAWPHLQVWDAASLSGTLTLETPAGIFRIYSPPANLPRKPMDNAAPIVVWQRGCERVLYVGDASLLSFENLPQEERMAHTLILGRNSRMPLADAEIIRATGASRIILLPSAAGLLQQAESLSPAEVIRIPISPDVLLLPHVSQSLLSTKR